MTGTPSEKVCAIVARTLGVDPAKVTVDQRLDDLGVDSLDRIEIVMAIEEAFRFHVDNDEADGFETVAELVAMVERLAA